MRHTKESLYSNLVEQEHTDQSLGKVHVIMALTWTDHSEGKDVSVTRILAFKQGKRES